MSIVDLRFAKTLRAMWFYTSMHCDHRKVRFLCSSQMFQSQNALSVSSAWVVNPKNNSQTATGTDLIFVLILLT